MWLANSTEYLYRVYNTPESKEWWWRFCLWTIFPCYFLGYIVCNKNIRKSDALIWWDVLYELTSLILLLGIWLKKKNDVLFSSCVNYATFQKQSVLLHFRLWTIVPCYFVLHCMFYRTHFKSETRCFREHNVIFTLMTIIASFIS